MGHVESIVNSKLVQPNSVGKGQLLSQHIPVSILQNLIVGKNKWAYMHVYHTKFLVLWYLNFLDEVKRWW